MGLGAKTVSEKHIPFTQFKTPDGRQVQIHVSRPEDIANKAEELIKLGGRFTAEVLMTGHVSIAFEYNNDDYMVEISPNDERLMGAVDKLIAQTYGSLIKDKKK